MYPAVAALLVKHQIRLPVLTAVLTLLACLTLTLPCAARPKTSDLRPQTSDVPAPAPAPSAPARVISAFQRVDAADGLLRAGRLGMALAGYLAILRDFPTWWLPMLKGAVAAHALGAGLDDVGARVDRAATLSPPGGPLSLVRAALALDAGLLEAVVAPLPAAAEASAMADRIALLRGTAFARLGRHAAAAEEYRAILVRTPGCAVARWRLAREVAALGRGDEASSMLREGASTSLFPPRWRAASGGPDRGGRGRAR